VHSRMNRASTAPVATCPTVEPIARAPDQIDLLLDECPCLREQPSICEDVRWSGPSMRYCRNCSTDSSVRVRTLGHSV
jgi:hypothetical protein